jgi:hypothetical protein
MLDLGYLESHLQSEILNVDEPCISQQPVDTRLPDF